jgi:YfiR/HmsC-like
MGSMQMISRRRLAPDLAAIILALAGLMPAIASAAPSAEADAVMAAIVYKITKFVTWPEAALASSTGKLLICVSDQDPLLPAMRSMHGRTTQGNVIEIREVTAANAAESGCHVLFMGAGESGRMAATLHDVASKPILTVGNADDFAEHGGIIGLRVEQNRIAFIVNTKASARAGIGISAQLLQLATVVTGEG